jgi:hypothetical protein
VNGADWKSFFKTKLGKFRSTYIGPASVHFVDGHENGFAAAAETGGGFTVEWDDTFLNIDDKDYDIGGLDREFDLVEGGASNNIIRLFAAKQADAAGIHEGKWAAMPFGFNGNTIAGYTRAVVDDGDSAPDNAVEQRGFSYIRATDDGDESWHTSKMRQKGALRKEK